MQCEDQAIISPSSSSLISGQRIQVPPSKSHSMRALLFATLASGRSCVRGILDSPDVMDMVVACRALGARILKKGGGIEIIGVDGKVTFNCTQIDGGNSGLVLRFIAALIAVSDQPITLSGDFSLSNLRPIFPLADALEQMGARVCYLKKKGFAPVEIRGPLQSSVVKMDGKDSQPVSALLMASIFLQGKTEIYVSNPGETPWIDLSLYWMKKMGLEVISNSDYTYYSVCGKQQIPSFELEVPGDYSSAAYPLAFAALHGLTLTLTGLDRNDIQGDRYFIEILESMGTHFQWLGNDSLKVVGKYPLRGVTVDLNRCVDMITILAVLGCFAEGEMILYNGAIARQKECDRISVITKQLKKMGAHIEELPDGMRILSSPLSGTDLECFQDHRIALALTVAASKAYGKSTLKGISCVRKTYAQFFSQLYDLGLDIQWQFQKEVKTQSLLGLDVAEKQHTVSSLLGN